MAEIVICLCGIARDDCEYHKPEPETKEYFQGRVYKDVTYTFPASKFMETYEQWCERVGIDPGHIYYEVDVPAAVELKTIVGNLTTHDVSFGTWSSPLTFTEEEIAKDRLLENVAARVGDYWRDRMLEMMKGMF